MICTANQMTGIYMKYNTGLKWLSEFENFRSSSPEVFFKKGVLKNFAKFTGKHLRILRNF